jgi:hypothetical protein
VLLLLLALPHAAHGRGTPGAAASGARPAPARQAQPRWPGPVALQGSALLIGWYSGAIQELLDRGVIVPKATAFSGLSGGGCARGAARRGGAGRGGVWGKPLVRGVG